MPRTPPSPSSSCGLAPMRSSTTAGTSTPGSWRRTGPAPERGTLAVGLEGRIVGSLDDPDPLEGEVAEPGTPEDEVLGDRPEGPRVLAVRPVVAHHEIRAIGHDPLPGALAVARNRRGRRPVRLVHDVRLFDPDRALARAGDEHAPVLER